MRTKISLLICRAPRGYRFMDDGEALAWLAAHARPEEAGRLLGWAAQEPGPVAPRRIGRPVQVRLGALLPAVDEWAARRDCSRAAAVRRLIKVGLAHAMTPVDHTKPA
ncbi:hypothetical protein [Streptomyces sp. NPDC094466]|uniref:hypothetical protein n=1 Tax=Streptomyces sp. NPDC094466 TaxID=3366065 RepID=UPI0037F2285E